MNRPRQGRRYEATDHDAWVQPGASAALLLSSVVWVLWWVASLVVGSIRLAIRRQEDGMSDDAWGAGGRR